MKQIVIADEEKNKSPEAFLMHAADEAEADTVESLLRSYDIPVLKKRRETGDYLNIATGMNVFGVDIYVPTKFHRAANALVRIRKRRKNEPDTEFEIEQDEFRKKRLIRIWIIIGIFYSPILIWMIISLFR